MNWSDKEYCLGRGVAGLFGHKDKLDQKYLWHWLKNVAPLLKSKGKGATFLQVTKEDICSLEIVLPPLEEQRRIASILDQADELRQKRQQAIEKLDQLLQATFIDMFGDPVSNPKGWDIGCIGDMLESVKYGSSDKATLEGEIPILRMNNLTYSGEMNLTDLKYITKVQADEKYLVKEGDILFARSGATVGKTFQFKNYNGVACFAGYLIKASPNPELILSDYLYLFTKTSNYEQWKNSIFNQATIQNIGADKYAYLDITIPKVEEQKVIIDHIYKESDRIDSKIKKTKKLIDLLIEYRSALISEVVTGKVKVIE